MSAGATKPGSGQGFAPVAFYSAFHTISAASFLTRRSGPVMLELSHRRLAGSHAYPVGDAAAADSLAIVNLPRIILIPTPAEADSQGIPKRSRM